MNQTRWIPRILLFLALQKSWVYFVNSSPSNNAELKLMQNSKVDLRTIWCQEVSQLTNNFAVRSLLNSMTVQEKLVLDLESLFRSADFFREDLACLLKSVQTQEKQKLQLTATIQVLKKVGRPSERLVSHENCRFNRAIGHQCVHINKITEASGTEEAEADAEYDNALKEAIKGVQNAVITINEHLEEVRYEIAALETE
ncbi:uncharacterized protein [Coffea arabica]|uniref:Uncharacterized protein isoform X4 n=1 Tax=Coffea arabica TaxID=13443 RepID=A0A6P6VXK7_COFAR|nr:uncharacterized protein LOC113727387 isoform X3 [Coffea arabica]